MKLSVTPLKSPYWYPYDRCSCRNDAPEISVVDNGKSCVIRKVKPHEQSHQEGGARTGAHPTFQIFFLLLPGLL